MLVLTPTAELLARLEPLLAALEPIADAAIRSLVARARAHLADRPGEPIPRSLVSRLIVEAASLAEPDDHPAVAASKALCEHLDAHPACEAAEAEVDRHRLDDDGAPPKPDPTDGPAPSSAGAASPGAPGPVATPTAAEAAPTKPAGPSGVASPAA